MILVLAAALSGCGSNEDSGSSAGTTTSSTGTAASGDMTALQGWATGLCQAVASWQGTVKSTSAKMANSQADFATASEAITSADQALVGSLNGLGTPPAPATAQAQSVIDELSANLEDQSGEIEKALSGVRTQSQIVTASTRVRASISKMNGDISKTVTELKALPDEQGWKQSFQQAPACRTVATG